MYVIMSIENGNVFDYTADGMRAAYLEACELYDIDDPTNEMGFWDYYKVVALK